MRYTIYITPSFCMLTIQFLNCLLEFNLCFGSCTRPKQRSTLNPISSLYIVCNVLTTISVSSKWKYLSYCRDQAFLSIGYCNAVLVLKFRKCCIKMCTKPGPPCSFSVGTNAQANGRTKSLASTPTANNSIIRNLDFV